MGGARFRARAGVSAYDRVRSSLALPLFQLSPEQKDRWTKSQSEPCGQHTFSLHHSSYTGSRSNLFISPQHLPLLRCLVLFSLPAFWQSNPSNAAESLSFPTTSET